MQIILTEIDHIEDNGTFDIDVELNDDITVHMTGRLDTDGYYENDYYNGTGAYIETYRSANIELTATLYKADGNCEEVAIATEQQQEAEQQLNAA